MQLTLKEIKAELTKKGHTIFETGKFNLNLVGIRTLPGVPNIFDDLFYVFYKDSNGIEQIHEYQITTDPGFYWLKNPMNVNGTAVLIPGQYRACWKIGLHHGKYKALVQNGSPFKVWRDKDKDGYIDYNGPIYNDVIGLNCHKAGTNSAVVEKFSAGCQVFKREAAHNELMSLCEKQIANKMGSTFSYSLLEYPF